MTPGRREGRIGRRTRRKEAGILGPIKKFDYLATSDVELTVAALAMGDQPIVRPGRRSLLLVVLVVLVVLLVLVLSVVSGLP